MRATHSFEMSIPREEFRRQLPRAVGNEPYTEQGNVFIHEDHGQGWRIVIDPLPPMVLGAISLERHRVDVQFTGYAKAEIEAFLERFAMHFRRGGG